MEKLPKIPKIYWAVFWLLFSLATFLIFSDETAGLYLLIPLFIFGMIFCLVNPSTIHSKAYEINKWMKKRHPFIIYSFAIIIIVYFIYIWIEGFTLFSFILFFCLSFIIIMPAIFFLTIAGYSKSKRDIEKKKKYNMPGDYTFGNIPAYCIVGLGLLLLHATLFATVKIIGSMSKSKKFKKRKKIKTKNLVYYHYRA